MSFYHATLKRNVDSIQKHGLSPNFALNQKNPRVWLHTKSKREWATLHVMKKHKVDMSQVVILEVHVTRSKRKRRWRGIWTTTHILTEFQSITDASELGASPIGDSPC